MTALALPGSYRKLCIIAGCRKVFVRSVCPGVGDLRVAGKVNIKKGERAGPPGHQGFLYFQLTVYRTFKVRPFL
jgi:hypothetical protein